MSGQAKARGFTLIEVLVALSIVAVALLAGLQATGALSNNAQRQTLSMLGQICAENELIRCDCSASCPMSATSRANACRLDSRCRCACRCKPHRTRTSAVWMPGFLSRASPCCSCRP